MRVLIILAVYVAVCASAAVTVVPEDNSHYVEGESRYIWMSDDEGIPHLVDLHEPAQRDSGRSGANNQYLLYTRSNPTTPQVIVDGDVNSVWNSNFNPSHELKVVVHGWGGSGTGGSNRAVSSAFLDNGEYNIIAVDWSTVGDLNYVSAASGVPDVGRFLGNFLVWLVSVTGSNWSGVHLIGFSLGAHVVGNAGRAAHGFPARVTGLDPAGPLWTTSSNSMSPADGAYVETINTDGRVTGIMLPVGDANFYPNGGRNPQPGCILNNCSHSRAVQLFASSVHTDHFVGRQCEDLEQAESNSCTGSTLNMGNRNTNKRGSGLYSLNTGGSWPF